METYNASNTEKSSYDLFTANMTLDTEADMYSGSVLVACKSCQCNCRTCLGGKAPEGTDISCSADAKSVLEELLAA